MSWLVRTAMESSGEMRRIEHGGEYQTAIRQSGTWAAGERGD